MSLIVKQFNEKGQRIDDSLVKDFNFFHYLCLDNFEAFKNSQFTVKRINVLLLFHLILLACQVSNPHSFLKNCHARGYSQTVNSKSSNDNRVINEIHQF